jgi:diguanylate cyclase (GGDEF)-like protein
MVKKWFLDKPSSLKSREELLEENILLYKEVLTAREAASITANLVVEQFVRMEEINQSLGRANDELQRISSLDGLTGISNRRFHDEMLELEWRRCRRNSLPLTLVMIDIDYFKLYNDCYGHPSGDHCLKQVAQTLQAVIHRSTDLVARYGGEEFVYTLSESDRHTAFSVAENARTAIEQLQIPHEASKVAAYVTISLGIASIVPEHSVTPSTLVRCADQALYQAKENGRNRVEIYGKSV